MLAEGQSRAVSKTRCLLLSRRDRLLLRFEFLGKTFGGFQISKSNCAGNRSVDLVFSSRSGRQTQEVLHRSSQIQPHTGFFRMNATFDGENTDDLGDQRVSVRRSLGRKFRTNATV